MQGVRDSKSRTWIPKSAGMSAFTIYISTFTGEIKTGMYNEIFVFLSESYTASVSLKRF